MFDDNYSRKEKGVFRLQNQKVKKVEESGLFFQRGWSVTRVTVITRMTEMTVVGWIDQDHRHYNADFGD